MRPPLVLLLVLGLVLDLRAGDDDYQPGPDSLVQAGIPQGELIKGTYTAKEGSVFPGTERDYTIYLPVGFDKTKPAPFMVFQDGVIYNAPVVFDNLIAKHELPPLIGIFIKPGIVPAANPNALPRYNRSYEYDSVSDTYSRFLIDEFLRAIAKKHNLHLSTDPNDAAIAGNSSGGICAFMTAWHRPDRIRRVFSGVGTYVGIHGADQLPVLVRKYEPKPLRIYLQSGEHDNNLYCGDWWMANQTMERALTWAGYDVAHTWGTGGHNAKHATAIFPDVLRWLWRDYATAREIKPNPRGESKWRGYEVIGDGKWEVAAEFRTTFITPFSNGQLLAEQSIGSQPYLVRINPATGDSDRMITLFAPARCAGFTVAKDDVILASVGGTSIRSFMESRKDELIIKPERSFSSFVINFANELFWSDGDEWRSLRDPRSRIISGRAFLPSVERACLSPDQSLIYSTRSEDSTTIYSHQILHNGSVGHGQAFAHLDRKYGEDHAYLPRGLCVDTNGWLYVATALGIQVCDQAGRVNFIIPTPQQPHDVCFGGKDLGELFIACGDKIYKRPTKAHGIVSGQMAPIKPPPPKL